MSYAEQIAKLTSEAFANGMQCGFGLGMAFAAAIFWWAMRRSK